MGTQVRYSANKSDTTTLQGSNFLKRFPDFGSTLPTPKIPLRCSKNSRTTNPIKFRTTLTTTEPMLTKMPSSESRYSYARLQTVPRPGISGMPELNDSKVRPRPSVQGFESLLSNQQFLKQIFICHSLKNHTILSFTRRQEFSRTILKFKHFLFDSRSLLFLAEISFVKCLYLYNSHVFL